MQLKLSVILLLFLACFGCGPTPQNYRTHKLPSGKEVKVTSVAKMDFPNSDPALVMNYVTDISIDEKETLRREIDEIWSVFQKDVENARLNAGVIRATQIDYSGLIKPGRGYGFVFVKRADGKWHCLDDE